MRRPSSLARSARGGAWSLSRSFTGPLPLLPSDVSLGSLQGHAATLTDCTTLEALDLRKQLVVPLLGLLDAVVRVEDALRRPVAGLRVSTLSRYRRRGERDALVDGLVRVLAAALRRAAERCVASLLVLARPEVQPFAVVCRSRDGPVGTRLAERLRTKHRQTRVGRE